MARCKNSTLAATASGPYYSSSPSSSLASSSSVTVGPSASQTAATSLGEHPTTFGDHR